MDNFYIVICDTVRDLSRYKDGIWYAIVPIMMSL